jgi:hypothetical protein
MCGIFGFVGRLTDQKKFPLAHKFLSELAIASEARGTDATGFVARWPKNLFLMDKMPIRASHFVHSSYKFQSLAFGMPTTFIGHTRLGTGSSPKINNNNHPFIGDHFYMVHNGIIPSWKDICEKNSVTMESETDSEVVLRLLESKYRDPEFNPQKEITRPVEWILDNVWGNMAIALLEQRNPNVWLFRNENPIWVWNCPPKVFGDDVWFFSSTKEIFENAWKKTFDHEPEKDGVSGSFLSDNVLYRLSTKGVETGRDNKLYKFVYYPLAVSNKFRKKKQYYGAGVGGEADWSGRYSTTTKMHDFFTKYDAKDPRRGGLFSADERTKIKKYMDFYDRDGTKTTLDGLPISDFMKLQDIMKGVQKAEEEKIASSTK